ncbi:hypothetical protein CIG75_04710 [Tumebacillus algifaecis]|uniref:DUF2334 domain-containing protein n=1 Tax=Tumebacillus algifaecis TaxID=1214604 RepID=A0A223CYE7_9BACL|nr:DUF2334 domain-containing protein [Tumebacillus algifaecis]ASS74351.1 hypothetical protein CIG75_04710 [Tumebacillus algifaecis]
MKKVLLAVLLAAVIALPVQDQTRTNSFPNHDKHHALLRLEDVSPGGSYATLDDLGRLRAVFDYLQAENVPIHLAVIPRSKLLQADGTWIEKGIDDPHPDQHLHAFIKLLQDAQQNGAVLGMHGYTHQYGDRKRGDGWHDTGVGYEFDLQDAPETSTVPYAVEKISKSLSAFEKAGLKPSFWESPHYQDTRQQEEVFRSFIGVLYQPDYFSLKSFKDEIYYQSENTYGETTLGSVYVPAPLSYVTGPQDVERILKKSDHFQGLGAVFYHSFLEYEAMEAVLGADGQPEIRDGLPVYRYKQGADTYLHQIVDGMRTRGWEWMSLHDVLPFSPAHRIQLPLGTTTEHLLFGDVGGSGQDSLVVVDHDGHVSVLQGNYNWPRNRSQSPFSTWLQSGLDPDDIPLLADVDGNGVTDLLAYHKTSGELKAYSSNTLSFDPGQSYGTLKPDLEKIVPVDLNKDGKVDLLVQNRKMVTALFQDGSHFRPKSEAALVFKHDDAILLSGDVNGDKQPEVILYSPSNGEIELYTVTPEGAFHIAGNFSVPQPKRNGQVVLGDTDGDGLADLVIYDPTNGIWEIWQGDAKLGLKRHDTLYGPWAYGKRVAFAADLDGNGKADIVSFDPKQSLLDLSLSFRHAK